MSRVNCMRWGSALLLVTGLVLCGEQCYLRAKAQLAAALLDRALQASLRDGARHRPWPWADLAPIARLDAPRVAQSRVVIDSAAGSAMAFGLGHVDGTALPGSAGNVVLAGHRDSWARYLEELQRGDELVLTSTQGSRRYRVSALLIVDRAATDVLTAAQGDRLTLITCYPFTALLPSRERYIVVAVPQ